VSRKASVMAGARYIGLPRHVHRRQTVGRAGNTLWSTPRLNRTLPHKTRLELHLAVIRQFIPVLGAKHPIFIDGMEGFHKFASLLRGPRQGRMGKRCQVDGSAINRTPS
jgi:hypothetical protein